MCRVLTLNPNNLYMSFNFRGFTAVLVIFYCFTACQSQKKLAAPMEAYPAAPEEKRSLFHIPVQLNIADLENTLNQELQGVLFNDQSFEDGDNLKLQATKFDRILFKADNKSISYSLPLALKIQYNAGILGIMDAKGDIAVDLRSEYIIQPDWKVVTKTEIVSHRWLKKPVLQVGGINLPVGYLVDAVLKNTKKSLGREIDDILHDYLGLSRVVSDTWDVLFQPILVSPEYSAWMVFNPTSIGMTPVGVQNNTISTTIAIEAKPLVSVGPRPEVKETEKLPPLTLFGPLEPGIDLSINTTVAWEEAERIAKTQVVGETYSSGKRKVTVEDLKLFGQNGKVIVNTRLSGSYNGSIYLSGTPELDQNTNKIKVNNLDFTLETKSFLAKGGAWLLKSTIKNRIQDNMNFLLGYNLEEMKNMLQSELNNFKIGGGLKVDSKVNTLKIGQLQLTPGGFFIGLDINGNLKVTVDPKRK
jgi:Domain of unknown function (DUF4403)